MHKNDFLGRQGGIFAIFKKSYLKNVTSTQNYKSRTYWVLVQTFSRKKNQSSRRLLIGGGVGWGGYFWGGQNFWGQNFCKMGITFSRDSHFRLPKALLGGFHIRRTRIFRSEPRVAIDTGCGGFFVEPLSLFFKTLTSIVRL